MAGHAAGGHEAVNPLAENPGTLFHWLAQLVHVPDWIVISWLIILVLVWFSWRATRKMELTPRGIQNLTELIVEGLYSFTRSLIGETGDKYAPFVGTLFLYILVMNVIGIVPGMFAPTAKLSTTVALGLTTIVFVQFYAIRELGLGPYLRHFCGEPLWLAPLMLPLHIISELAKPVSLSIRLFGNIFGKDMVIVNLIMLAAAFPVFLRWLPVQMPLLALAILVGFVQALVFAMLAAVYIGLFLGSHESEEHGHGES